MKFPESKMKAQYDTTKLNRWNLATHGAPKIAGRGLFRKMRLELVLFGTSIFLGLSKDHILLIVL